MKFIHDPEPLLNETGGLPSGFYIRILLLTTSIFFCGMRTSELTIFIQEGTSRALFFSIIIWKRNTKPNYEFERYKYIIYQGISNEASETLNNTTWKSSVPTKRTLNSLQFRTLHGTVNFSLSKFLL